MSPLISSEKKLRGDLFPTYKLRIKKPKNPVLYPNEEINDKKANVWKIIKKTNLN